MFFVKSPNCSSLRVVMVILAAFLRLFRMSLLCFQSWLVSELTFDGFSIYFSSQHISRLVLFLANYS